MMARKTEVRIDGLKDLQKDFEKLTKGFEPKQIEEASLESAEIIRADAERRAPRGPTGNLKKAQIKKPLKRGNNVASAIAAVDRKKAFYAGFVEFGTSRMAAQPYFRPAVESKGDAAAKHFREKLKQMVDEAVK